MDKNPIAGKAEENAFDSDFLLDQDAATLDYNDCVPEGWRVKKRPATGPDPDAACRALYPVMSGRFAHELFEAVLADEFESADSRSSDERNLACSMK